MIILKYLDSKKNIANKNVGTDNKQTEIQYNRTQKQI